MQALRKVIEATAKCMKSNDYMIREKKLMRKNFRENKKRFWRDKIIIEKLWKIFSLEKKKWEKNDNDKLRRKKILRKILIYHFFHDNFIFLFNFFQKKNEKFSSFFSKFKPC